MDKFYTQKNCNRCGKPLDGGRRMSRFNTDCLCLECADKERSDPEYEKAVQTELEEIKKGNYNYKGIRG